MTQPMDPTLWARVREMFEAAHELPDQQRARWLEKACQGDQGLRDQVLRLFEADARGGHPLDSPVDVRAVFEADGNGSGLAHGDHVGSYVIDRELARGGMGVVYRAWDTRLERWVAIKALSPALPADLQARDRLHREARAAGKVSHEAIATIYALEEVDDDLFIVSEFVDGRTVRARLTDGRLSVREAVDIVLGVSRGLAVAHEQGVVHRDLKPENVMLTPNGRVKVVDFGIASVGGSSGLTRTGVILGTPGYMSPEQISGQPADARSDVFSLGVLLYEMIGGRPPFGDTASWTVVSAVLERDPQPLGEFVDGVPAALERVVMTCLAKAPASRYPTAHAIVYALEPVLDDLRTPVASAVTPASARVASAETVDATQARWWLQFHQLAASGALALMMIPSWKLMSRLPVLTGRLLVMALFVMAAGIGTIRLHLWFTTLQDPGALTAEVARLSPSLRWSNRLFALLLGLGGAAIVGQHAELAAVCVACAAGNLVAGEVIEPAAIARALGRRT